MNLGWSFEKSDSSRRNCFLCNTSQTQSNRCRQSPNTQLVLKHIHILKVACTRRTHKIDDGIVDHHRHVQFRQPQLRHGRRP
uniref:Uncharacterized protein n=1 Tax=Setaria viridis TaxID=4556 RepID=A0A4V6D960_SETVI|nr:hypothetical protein SEVIR_3G065400v2 [Setaria viridis]